MARLMFALFAERVSVDRFSNLLDIHGLVEHVNVPPPSKEMVKKAQKEKKLLGAQGRLSLLLHWRRDDPVKPEPTRRSRVQLIDPQGKVIAMSMQDIALREHTYVRNLVAFKQLPVTGPGTYTARVALRSAGGGWRKVGETSFQLAYQQPAPVSAARVH